MKTTLDQLKAVALAAVRSELDHPLSAYHGYDRQAVVADIAYQIDASLNDEDAVLEAIRHAETGLGIDCLGVPDERLS